MASAAENITRHFKGDWHGSYGAIPTPGHSAKDRGTTVKMGDSGEVLFHAHNDPSFDWRGMKDECRSLGLIPERDRPDSGTGGWRETGAYTYRDASGGVLYRTVRKEKAGADKRFEAQRLEGQRWVNGMGSVERVPYRLPELLSADPTEPVFFVEGERKADKLAGWGMVATAIPFGAKGWRQAYAQHFAGRLVAILPDNDAPGREFAANVKAALASSASSIVTVDLPGLPPKGDVIDWQGSADDLRALVHAALNPPVETFPIADLGLWSVTAAAPKSFFMAGFVPAREVTLATGAGGANKSTFGQQLATCAAAGCPMLGVDVQQGPALYATAEDDEDRLHWMQEHICKAVGVRMSELAGRLFLTSLRGRLGNELATFDNEGKLRPSQALAILRATLLLTRAKLLVLDNSAHLYAGNENDRGQVTAFVNLLYSLCVELGVTIILIAHTNKAGDSYSGSTAWLNAVRSQIVLTRPEDSNDPDERVLTLGKANYARQGGELRFRWHDFALRLDSELSPDQRGQIAASAQAADENALFLRCLAKSTDDRRAVSHINGSNYAPRVFAKMIEANGAKPVAFERALERLLHLGRIKLDQQLWQGSDRHWKRGIRSAEECGDPPAVTPCGDLREPPPQVIEKAAGALRAATPLYTTYKAGAPEGAAASREEEENKRLDWSRFERRERANGALILAPGETEDDPVPGWEAP